MFSLFGSIFIIASFISFWNKNLTVCLSNSLGQAMPLFLADGKVVALATIIAYRDDGCDVYRVEKGYENYCVWT